MSSFDQPPPYGRIRGLLGAAAVERLLDYASASRDRFEASTVGDGEQKKVDPARRRSLRMKHVGELADAFEVRVRGLVPTMIEKLASPAFEPAKIELELVAHTNAAHLARHRDTRVGPPDGKPYRVISAVYYFFRQPKAFTGGVLRLHSMAATGASGSFVDIEPENDILVFFPSWFIHEVSPVVCPSGQFEDSRFAVNCWVARH